MSNHFHIVLRADPKASWDWTDRELAERWLAVFPGSISNRDDPACVERAILALLSNAERLEVIRQRLGSISWFMRALNEPIARMANREDGCTGRFWEGRFKCQALLDEQAVLSCMAYVDLNPVRAGMCETLRESEHIRSTSAGNSRIRDRKGARPKAPRQPAQAGRRIGSISALLPDFQRYPEPCQTGPGPLRKAPARRIPSVSALSAAIRQPLYPVSAGAGLSSTSGAGPRPGGTRS
jgi:hypothetical protein